MNPVMVQPHEIECSPDNGACPAWRITVLVFGHTFDASHDALQMAHPQKLEDGSPLFSASGGGSGEGRMRFEIGLISCWELMLRRSLN